MALASLVTVIVFIVAVSGSKDDLPGDIRDCVKRGGAGVVHGPANLGVARAEIDAGTLRRDRHLRKGDDTVIVLSGQRFRLLVLANASSPTLAGDLARRLYERADEYPLVALERDPVKGILYGCSSIAAE
ncbi:MAG: hypothetical protein JWO02_336 [Solirubrobacterales bacterium]|nr:hypothetical protein [Solirubrobacterales bacterium]